MPRGLLERVARPRPKRASLAEELDRIKWEEEELVFEGENRVQEQLDAGGFTLNPLQKQLGPLQKLLHGVLTSLRTCERVFRWDDPILTLELCLGLVVACLLLIGLCYLITLMQWAHVFEVAMRLLGVLVFGPHMLYRGREFFAARTLLDAEARAFAQGGAVERRAILAAHRQRIRQEAMQRLAEETASWGGHQESQAPRSARSDDARREGDDEAHLQHHAGAGTASRESEPEEEVSAAEVPGLHSLPAHIVRRQLTQGHVIKHASYHHLLIRPRPVAGKMRVRCEADWHRSRTYLLHPAEDRPPPLSDADAYIA